jgi:hypothetical protein
VEKFKELGDIQIVARCETFQPFGDKKIGGEGIRHVEGEVADHGEFGGTEIIKGAEVADEDSVGFGVLDQSEKTCLSGFLNSRSRKIDGGLGLFPNGFNGRAETAEIFEVEIKEIGSRRKEGFRLSGVTTEDGEFCVACDISTCCRMSKCLLGGDGCKKLR